MIEARDQLDGLHPLDLLEAELELVAQAERCPVDLEQRFAVHLVGEDRLLVAHVLDPVAVVVEARPRCLGPLAEGVEDHPPRLGERLHQIEDVRHRRPAPLGDP